MKRKINFSRKFFEKKKEQKRKEKQKVDQ